MLEDEDSGSSHLWDCVQGHVLGSQTVAAATTQAERQQRPPEEDTTPSTPAAHSTHTVTPPTAVTTAFEHPHSQESCAALTALHVDISTTPGKSNKDTRSVCTVAQFLDLLDLIADTAGTHTHDRTNTGVYRFHTPPISTDMASHHSTVTYIEALD